MVGKIVKSLVQASVANYGKKGEMIPNKKVRATTIRFVALKVHS